MLHHDKEHQCVPLSAVDIALILVVEKGEVEFEKFTEQFISSVNFKNRLIELKRILKDYKLEAAD